MLAGADGGCREAVGWFCFFSFLRANCRRIKSLLMTGQVFLLLVNARRPLQSKHRQ